VGGSIKTLVPFEFSQFGECNFECILLNRLEEVVAVSERYVLTKADKT
jgi:hypothetical protein